MSGTPSFGRRLGRFASFNVLQHVWLAVLSLVATPVLYHGLGEAAYGILAMVNLAAAQLSILEFGFGHATIRQIARVGGEGNPAEVSKAVATSSWVFALTAALGGAVFLFGGDFLVQRYFQIPDELMDTGRRALRLGAVFFVFAVFGTLAGAVWQGLQRFGYMNLVAGISATAQLLGSVALVLLGYGVLEVLVWSVALGGAALVVQIRRLPREAPGVTPFGPPSREAFRAMAGFGFLLMLSGAFTQVFLSGTGLVLGRYVAIGALPFFTIPFGLYQRLTRMGYGLASALYPLVAEMDGLRDEPSLRRVFVSGTRLLLVAALAGFPGVLLARPFLHLWMGPAFAEQAAPVLELLLAAFGLSLATIPSVELARGRGRAGLLVQYTAVLAATSVTGALLLAPSAGAVGAARAFLAAQFVGSTFLMVRVGGAGCRDVLRARAVALALGTALCVTLGAALGSGLLPRLAATLVSWGVLAPLSWRWVLDEAERTTLRRMARRHP